MNNFLKISLLGISLSLSNIALAESSNKIAFVNVQTLREKSTAAVSIVDQLSKKAESARLDAVAKEKEIQKKFSDLESKKKTLSKTAFDAESSKVAKEAEEMTKNGNQQRGQFEKAYMEATSKFQETLDKVIQEKAKKDGLTAVFATMQTAYSDPALDITDSIMEDLNKALPNYTLNFDQK